VRHRPREDNPTLGALALMHAIAELASFHRLLSARVVYKMNAKGEHVVAIVFPPQPP
jgi:hypothetical protein